MKVDCSLLLLLTLTLLDQAHAQTDVGSACTLSRGAGVCQSIIQCQSVYNDLVSGKRPERTCGFEDRLPIVCCPVVSTEATTTSPVWNSATTAATRGALTDARPARRMCAVYAQSVYALQAPPAMVDDLVNVSLCAIDGKKFIVGGTKAEPKEFPYQAAVGYNAESTIRWECGGTLISESFVLTAAHCLNSLTWGLARWVRVGDLNLERTDDDAQPQDRLIVERIPHPSYQRPAQYHDIALLRLQVPVTFNAYVRPACLDVKGIHEPGERAVATGWGIVDWFDEIGSQDLLKVILPVVAYGNCQGYYNGDRARLPSGIDARTQLCAGEDGKDTCQGDSGGPLAVYSTDQECMYDVIGVTNFGQLCGSVSPAVYSRVYAYLPWIESIVWPGSG